MFFRKKFGIIIVCIGLNGMVNANTCPKWFPMPSDEMVVVIPIYDASITEPDMDCDGVIDSVDDDIDGDGISNIEENTNGTNPLNPDSDGDGISDNNDAFPLDPSNTTDTDGDDSNDDQDTDSGSDSNSTTGEVPTELPAGEYTFLRRVTKKDWDWLFPLRSGKYVPTTPCRTGEFLNCGGDKRNQPPYAAKDGTKDSFSLDAFKKAVLEYNRWATANNHKQFLNEGTFKQQAQEFIVFLAKSSRETSGSWETAKAPWIVKYMIGGKDIVAWKGGLYWVEEIGYSTNTDGTSKHIGYVDSTSKYKPEPGRSYHGRGIIQLSWNYNYGAFSEWLYKGGMMKDVITDKRTLLVKPNLVADNGILSILSGIWFWMTPQGAKPSSHDVLYGDIIHISESSQDMGLPQTNDGSEPDVAEGDTSNEAVFAYRLGTITDIVNGDIECNKAAKWHRGPVQRVMYYDAYAAYINNKLKPQVTRIEEVKASSREAWTQSVTDSSPDNLKNATCYNLKSYYGW